MFLKRLRSVWHVTNTLDPDIDYYYVSEQDADEFINKWIDVTLPADHPYKIGTKWWIASWDKEVQATRILQVTVTDISTEFLEYDEYPVIYSRIILDDGTYIISAISNDESRPTVEKALASVSLILKTSPEEFIRYPQNG